MSNYTTGKGQKFQISCHKMDWQEWKSTITISIVHGSIQLAVYAWYRTKIRGVNTFLRNRLDCIIAICCSVVERWTVSTIRGCAGWGVMGRASIIWCSSQVWRNIITPAERSHTFFLVHFFGTFARRIKDRPRAKIFTSAVPQNLICYFDHAGQKKKIR
jgi:hypothetical protein